MDKLLFRRILVAGLTALAIIYVVYLLLSANFNVIPTENAEQVTVTDKIYSNGYIIRDETYVKNTSGGVVSYNVDDGDEVKKGGSVASVFFFGRRRSCPHKSRISRRQYEGAYKT